MDDEAIEITDVTVHAEPGEDDALTLARQALDEVKAMRQEQDAAWQRQIMEKLSSIEARLSEAQQPRAEMEIVEPSAASDELAVSPQPSPGRARRTKRQRKLKL